MRRITFVSLFLLMASAGWPAASPQQSLASDRRIEGDWVRVDYEGAGSFGGLNASVPPAQLLPGVSAPGRGGGRGAAGGRGGARGAPPQNSGPNPVGVPYIVVQQPCGG